MANYLTSVLSAHLDTAQVRTFRHATRIENGTDRLILAQWRLALRALKYRRKGWESRLINAIAGIAPVARQRIEAGLKDQAKLAAKTARETLLAQVPVQVLSVAADAHAERLTERRATPAERREIGRILFPPMTTVRAAELTYRHTGNVSWTNRLTQATRLATPDQIAPIVHEWARGKLPPRELERRLMPVVQNVRVSAKRIARAEAAHIATVARMEEYERLGSMIIGYQVWGTMDSRIRPHHAARNGNIYYRNPGPNQLSMAEMPRPPIDEDGTLAFNCRCWLTPVVDVQPQIETDPAAKALFTDAAGKLVPDPSVYNDWFSKASDEDRREAVGARRFRTMRDKLQADPDWGHFLDPETGHLMPVDRLAAETDRQMAARMAKVNDLLAKRKVLAEKVLNYGYLPPDFARASDIKKMRDDLPKGYKSTFWRDYLQAEKITQAAQAKAIKERAKAADYIHAVSHVLRFGELRSFMTSAGVPLSKDDAARIAADAGFLRHKAKPISKDSRTILGLPPGTMAQVRLKPRAGLTVRNLAPVGVDVFDPVIRGMEQVEVVVGAGVSLITIGDVRYLPPGKYRVAAVVGNVVYLGAK